MVNVYNDYGIVQSLACSNTQESPLFNLEPYFQSNALDISNREYFPIDKHCKSSMNNKTLNYTAIENHFMDNEVKGFVRHLVVEKHSSVAHIKSTFVEFVRPWGLFVNEHFRGLRSVIDVDYEQLFDKYCSWLKSKGIKTESTQKIAAVTKNMELAKFHGKTGYVSSFLIYYNYINSIVNPDTRPEREKDIWDVRLLGVTYLTLPSRPRYTINFENIHQEWLRIMIKDYCFYRVQNKEMSTVLDDMKAFNLFSDFIRVEYPDFVDMSTFDRKMTEKYIAFVRAKGFVSSTCNRRISAIKTFFTIGNMLDMGNYPTRPLFIDSDYSKVVHKIPKPFSDEELRQINKNIRKLPIIYGRALFVLENCGMRVSDLCSSTIRIDGKPCLMKSGKDNFIFTYAQPKVHRTNSIPVSDLVAEVIRSAIEDSIEQYGEDCEYIFAKSNAACIGEEDFVTSLNKLSLTNGFTSDTGAPLRIKGHTFRKTKACEYANMGVTMDVIRMMLGQKKIGVLKHYITIHSATMIDAMSNITREDNNLIHNIGNIQSQLIRENNEETLLPLSNGYCSKNLASGLCNNAYNCYSCRMYRPSAVFLSIYKAQLREAESNIEIATINGYERLLQINSDLKVQLETIISKVTEVPYE